MSDQRLTGVIRSMKEKFGFITEDVGQGTALANAARDAKDYFFLPSALEKTGPQFHELREGMKVTFVGIEHPKGPRAIEIRVRPA